MSRVPVIQPGRAGGRIWIALSLGAGLMGAWLTVESADHGHHALVFAVIGALATLGVGCLPFRIVCPLLVTVTVLTRFSVPAAGLHLRPDMALMPGALLSCLLSGYGGRLARWARHPVAIWLAVFVVLNALVSVLASPDLKKSESISAWYLIDLVILLLVLAYYESDRQALLRRLLDAAFLTIVVGIAAWVLGAAHHHVFGASVDAGEGLRAYGLTYEPNILAGTAALGLVVVLGRGVRLTRREVAFCLAALVVIPLTATRAALIAIAIGSLISAVAIGGGTRTAKRVALAAAAIVGAGAVLTALAPSLVSPLLGKLVHLNIHNQTASYRYEAWRLAVHDLHGAHWLVGLGTNSYGMRHIEPTSIYHAVPSPGYLGNLPLNTVYDTGLAGLLCLTVVVVRLVGLGTNSGGKFRRGAVAVTFLIIATSTSPFFFAYFWLFMAAGLTGTGRPTRARSGPEQAGSVARGSISVGSTIPVR